MKRLLLIPVFAATLAAQDANLTAWKWSLAAVAGSSAFDAESSWGQREFNPILAGQNSRFGIRGVVVKTAMLAPAYAVQIAFVRNHPRYAKALSVVNFACAGVFTAVAVRNMKVRNK